jgi:hypothetical protein
VELRDDENFKYDPNAPLPEDKLMETTPLQQHTVEIPMYEGDFTQSQPLEEEGELEEDEEGEDPREDVQKFSEAHQLPTPETTPGPSNEPLYTEQPERPVCQPQHRPSRDIREDIDKSNIVKGSRSRKPRREAYMVQLNKPRDSPSGYSTAFIASILENKNDNLPREQIHRNQLPHPPRTWRKHPDLRKLQLRNITTYVKRILSRPLIDQKTHK